ncbi:MAG: hypothetical protein ACE5I9_07365 [Candidatus Methylomirabilales bacterium]
MKGVWRDRWNGGNLMLMLLLGTMVVWGACSGRGPLRVEGVVTGKRQIASKVSPSEGGGKERPLYFLWVKTEDGKAFVEVTEEVFQSVAEGDRVCINCDAERQ